MIEDEESVREVIVEFLEEEGFQTVGVGSGKDGIQVARELQPDLIICDILMSDMNGYTVLAELKQEPTTAKIPFIFLTARTGEAALQLGLELGADNYLEKPIKIANLLEAIAIQLNLPLPKDQSTEPPLS